MVNLVPDDKVYFFLCYMNILKSESICSLHLGFEFFQSFVKWLDTFFIFMHLINVQSLKFIFLKEHKKLWISFDILIFCLLSEPIDTTFSFLVEIICNKVPGYCNTLLWMQYYKLSVVLKTWLISFLMLLFEYFDKRVLIESFIAKFELVIKHFFANNLLFFILSL